MSQRMPVLFVGHGSPMNAIEENIFVQEFRALGKNMQTPRAIVCVSAHWETRGTRVTAMDTPKTIHDFMGFPQALYEISYPAPGSKEIAQSIKGYMHNIDVALDMDWGLDHGTWSVLRHMYPDAHIPVVQISLDHTKSMQDHVQVAQKLQELRNEGVLVIGSGNIVHNLSLLSWRNLSEETYAHAWASQAHQEIKDMIVQHDIEGLMDILSRGESFTLAIPTPEHYLPLLYAIAITDQNDTVRMFNDRVIGGSLSMLSVQWG